MASSAIIIEVCVDSVQSAINAVEGGADRIELCGNLGLGGGTTPSLGLLRAVQSALKSFPIMVMIRPRTGDFLYSDDEMNVMLEDVRIFKSCGVRGIVVGILTKDGLIDVNRMKRIVTEALPLEVCFHRAFDMTINAEQALSDILRIQGISRVLTSGRATSVIEGIETLQLLHQIISSREDGARHLVILPGSGVNGDSIGLILKTLLPLGLQEIHLSGGSWKNSDMVYRCEGMGMGTGGDGEWGVWTTSSEKVRMVRHIIDAVVCT